MSNLMAGSLNNNFQRLEDDRLEVISILINNACNLHCRHCYLQTHAQDEYLTHDQWMTFFSTLFADIQPKILCFAGKEVFVNKESVHILLDAISLRNKLQPPDKRRTEIGVITNGTLIHKYFDLLENISPDYLDVSIDGLPDTHDAIRGKETFKKLEPNLNWLTNSFPGPVWVTHTLCAENYRSLPDFLSFYSQNHHMNKFSIGFYKQTNLSDSHLKLSEFDISELTDVVIPKLAHLQLTQPMDIIFEMDCTQADLIEHFAKAGFAHPVDAIASNVIRYENGLTLHFNTTRVPTGLWRSVRVTPEGFWLAGEDLIEVHQYRENAIGKLDEYGFDTVKFYQAGLKSIKKEKILFYA
ncbi:MAG: radical SAM protein [Calditrichaeota bacterium]|nr:MAG: radical SAM protein [Calditrichota bacterium]